MLAVTITVFVAGSSVRLAYQRSAPYTLKLNAPISPSIVASSRIGNPTALIAPALGSPPASFVALSDAPPMILFNITAYSPPFPEASVRQKAQYFCTKALCCATGIASLANADIDPTAIVHTTPIALSAGRTNLDCIPSAHPGHLPPTPASQIVFDRRTVLRAYARRSVGSNPDVRS